MAIDKFLDNKVNNKYNELVIEGDNADPLMIYLKSLATKLDEGLTKTNTHIAEMTEQKAKTGISTAQANAIVANTAKTGITSSQANAITANTKKIGMSLAKGIDNLSFSFSKGTLSVTVISGKDRYVVGLKMTKL